MQYIITWDIWMHKDSIWKGQKVGLLNLVKSPIGAKSSFQIHLEAHELEKSSRKANKGWKYNSYTLLLGENYGGWCGQKNKSTTLSLAFPFALFLNKTGNFAEKQICALEDLE